MDQAKEQRAAEFAPPEWRNAEDAWQKAQGLLASESYGEAGTLLLRAKSRFERAHDIAKSKRDDVRKEMQGMESTIDLRYKSLKDNISRAKLAPPRKQSLTDSCADIDKNINKIKAEMEQGNIPGPKKRHRLRCARSTRLKKSSSAYVTGKKQS